MKPRNILRLSWIIVFLLFSATAIAEQIVPPGSKVILPSGAVILFDRGGTFIDDKEKEILVKNYDLCENDKDKISLLDSKVIELEKQISLNNREIQLERDRANLEQKRAEFYKEQMEFKDKMNKDILDKTNKLIDQSKPSFVDSFINKYGIAIGIIIGVLIAL